MRPCADTPSVCQPTSELILRARCGDRTAVDTLLRRHLPPLRRWAHGRIPAGARGRFDTCDLVQDAVFRSIALLDRFEPRQGGGIQAYLRMAVINRVRDEARRLRRQAGSVAFDEGRVSDETSPLDEAIRRETNQKCGEALLRLRPKDRRLVLARVQLECSFAEIARRFDLPTPAAARMAFNRALLRLRGLLEGNPTPVHEARI